MAIIEIWVTEAVIVFFLALPLFRPFVKKLWPLEGLTWLPLIALGILIGIFPAYGFRPECLPILIFAVVYNTVNLFPIISGASSRPNDSFRDRGPALTLFTVILLTVAALPMFAFSSKADAGSEEAAETVKVLKVSNRIMGQNGIFDREYLVRIYGMAQADRPLVFIVPPEVGSVASIDLVCTELQKKDFTVVTYSFKDYDLFRKHTTFYPAKLLAYWRIFRKADILVSANEQGQIWEAERRKEVEFLLSRLPSLLNDTGNGNVPPVLLAGYGAGGSALAYLADESSFISAYGNVQGVVAIESRLWSAYLPEPRKVRATSLAQGMIRRQWTNIVNRLDNMQPQRVSRNGPLPGAELSGRGLPVLYLVSGRALDSSQGQKPYQAVFDALRSGSGPVAIAAIEGAGPLDYQDYPLTHPVYSFLSPGLKGARQSAEPIGDTAGIIGNFASLLLEQSDFNPPPRHTISGRLYVESRGLPGFRL
jgi:hypothetical protein